MLNKQKTQKIPKPFCGRCHRVGHLAQECYTFMCDYCKTRGHDMQNCRTLQEDREYIIELTKEFYRHASENAEDQPSTSSENSTKISTLSTIGAYREYLMSPYIDIVEISTPELKSEKAKMVVSLNCPFTLIKIGKLKDDVSAAKEVIGLDDIYGAPIKTICIICLSIHVNNTIILHPCRVVSDDFCIETDGVLGIDFTARTKIKYGKYVELIGVRIPFIPNEFVRREYRISDLGNVPDVGSDSKTLTGSSK